MFQTQLFGFMLAVTLDKPQSFPLLITRLVLTLKRHEWACFCDLFRWAVGCLPTLGTFGIWSWGPCGAASLPQRRAGGADGLSPRGHGVHRVSLPTTGAARRGLRGRGQLGTAQQLPTPFLYRLRLNFKHHGENWTKLNGGEA